MDYQSKKGIINIILLLSLSLVFSCSSEKMPEIKTDVIYKKDMVINHGGKSFIGVAVLPEFASYDLHIVAKGELDLFTFTNCHRDENSENAWNVTEKKRSFIFSKTVSVKNEIKMKFTPTDLEKNGVCPVFLGGYEEQRGRHSWGMVDFEDKNHKLMATIQCNGESSVGAGVSACQSRSGLFQKISFAVSVKVMPDDACSIGMNEGKSFEFPIKSGQCVYVFMSENGALHRFTTFGYDQVLIRK